MIHVNNNTKRNISVINFRNENAILQCLFGDLPTSGMRKWYVMTHCCMDMSTNCSILLYFLLDSTQVLNVTVINLSLSRVQKYGICNPILYYWPRIRVFVLLTEYKFAVNLGWIGTAVVYEWNCNIIHNNIQKTFYLAVIFYLLLSHIHRDEAPPFDCEFVILGKCMKGDVRIRLRAWIISNVR